jgi:hypothetical protein
VKACFDVREVLSGWEQYARACGVYMIFRTGEKSVQVRQPDRIDDATAESLLRQDAT